MRTILAALLLSFIFPAPPRTDNSAASDTVSLRIIGDVMMHSRQMQYPQESFLKHIGTKLESADIAVANMEFSLAGEPHTGYPAFSAPDSFARYVADCGVDVFLCANNHLMDKGPKGAKRTLDIYSGLPVKFTGCARDSADLTDGKPLIIRSKGISLALVNFSYGSNYPLGSGWPRLFTDDLKALGKEMEKAEKEADFTIALPHWGTEYETHHSKRQEELAAELVKMGADAIIGSHPHVIQDSSHINGVPVVYSVGNAVSNMSAKNTRLELMVTLRFTRDRLSGRKQMLEPELSFMWCTLPGTLGTSYSTILVDEWLGQRDKWISPYDYDNMTATLKRIKEETGIK